MEKLQDITLINAYYQGDESALATLIERYNQVISSFIYNKVRDYDLMNDIFQDTFIKIIQSLKKEGFKEGGSFKSWAIRIAQNLIYDHYRTQKRIPIIQTRDDFDILSLIPDQSKDVGAESMTNGLRRNMVEKLLDGLQPEQVRVITLRFYHQLSFKEIAEQEGFSINTALGRARYALSNMKKRIAKEGVSIEQFA